MEIPSKSVIIPVDFTEGAEFAFEHALIISKYMEREIVLLHIISKDDEYAQALARIEDWSKKMYEKHNVKSIPIVKKGDIFKNIKSTSIEINALMIIMGLHNAKRAFKTITGSTIPFLLVQDHPRSNKINDIIVPFDYNEDARVQLNWAVLLSKYFNCNINIFKPYIESNAKNEKMKKNMFFIKKILDDKEVIYGVRTSKREDKYNDAVYDFAKEINADMIFIMSYDFKKFILKSTKFNMKFPILCINPAATKIIPGKF